MAGIPEIAYGVSDEAFTKLIPGERKYISCEEAIGYEFFNCEGETVEVEHAAASLFLGLGRYSEQASGMFYYQFHNMVVH